MTRSRSKADLLADIQAQHRNLEKVIAGLQPEDMLQVGAIGDWSVKDVLSHLAAWEQLFLNWYECGVQGKVPDTGPVGMGKKAIDTLNQRIYNQFRLNPLEDVLFQFQDSYQQILRVVETMTQEELYTPGQYGWTGRWTVADYVAGNTCNHYLWAKSKIRDWLKLRERL